MEKIGFFEVAPGNKSQGRLIAFIMIVVALIFAQEAIWFSRNNVMVGVAAGASIFLSIAGPALTFLYNQKKIEATSSIDKPVSDS